MRPDTAAALRRGARLRRRRTLARSAAVTVALVAVIGVAALLRPQAPPSVPPVGDGPSTTSIEQLDVFERPARADDRIPSMVHFAVDDPGVQRRGPRLDPPGPQVGTDELADADTYPLDADRRAARLGWRQGRLTVHLAPPTGDPVDPDLRPLPGEWLYVVLDRPGPQFTGSAPVPAPGTAAWAGSVPVEGVLTGILVVGDGLEQAHGPAGSVRVQDNVVLVEDVGRGDDVTLTGPAGDFVLSIPDPADAR